MSERPDLQSFFAGIGAYYQDPSPEAAAAWLARHPGWEAAPARLGVYGHHARQGVVKTLALLFPGTHDALSAGAWRNLTRAYYATRPATAYEINEACAGFPAFVAARVDVPDFLPALVAFEWAIFRTYKLGDELPDVVEALTVNPTLQTHEHGWRLCPYLANDREGVSAPEPGDELALTWRHPQTLRTRYATATPRALLALKLVLEAIPLERAAQEGGVGVAQVQAALDDAVERGLLLAPA